MDIAGFLYSWVAPYSSIDMVSLYVFVAVSVAHAVTELGLLYFCALHGFLQNTEFDSRSKCPSSTVFAWFCFS